MSYNFKRYVIILFALIVLGFVVYAVAGRTINQDVSVAVPDRGISNVQNGKEVGKIFENTYFSLIVPSDWVSTEQNSIHSTENDLYWISYAVQDKDDVKNTEAKKLLDQKNYVGYEELRFKNACRETDACGEMSGQEEKDLNGVTSLSFNITYSGIAADEPRGNRIETYHIIFKDGKEYRFWTSETVAPDDLLARFPKLVPPPSERFREIMDTLKLK